MPVSERISLRVHGTRRKAHGNSLPINEHGFPCTVYRAPCTLLLPATALNTKNNV
jgi:hypothetical protein